jgi:hypothetical protein
MEATTPVPPSKSRRPHYKSRKGCVQCKQRKVKVRGGFFSFGCIFVISVPIILYFRLILNHKPSNNYSGRMLSIASKTLVRAR